MTVSSRPLARSARQAFADAWALIAPVDCAGCGAPDRALCPSCALDLQSRPLLGTLDFATPTAPRAVMPALPVAASLPYDGVVRRVVLALKEQGCTELARPLARPLAVAVERAWHESRAELLVPVPGS
ncbi:MAG: hypothetical protein Q7J04_10025, partial [Microcella sp.]|nr:hypothetical protein [Microcella sp.]